MSDKSAPRQVPSCPICTEVCVVGVAWEPLRSSRVATEALKHREVVWHLVEVEFRLQCAERRLQDEETPREHRMFQR